MVNNEGTLEPLTKQDKARIVKETARQVVIPTTDIDAEVQEKLAKLPPVDHSLPDEAAFEKALKQMKPDY